MSQSQSQSPSPSPSLTLAVMAKDEEAVIERAIESTKDVCEYVVVTDTGSSDQTKEAVLKGQSGQTRRVYTAPWEDFGANRTALLEIARTDPVIDASHTLMLDADEELSGNTGAISSFIAEHPADAYSLTVRLCPEAAHAQGQGQGQDALTGPTCEYQRVCIFDNRIPWRYEMPLHEYPTLPEADAPKSPKILSIPGVYVLSHRDGARAKDPKRFERDARMLEQYLSSLTPESPNYPRALFYLAQSYRDAGNTRQAVLYYSRRVAHHTGYGEERFYSTYMLGKLTGDIDYYHSAIDMRPHRPEPALILAKYHMGNKRFRVAQMYLEWAFGKMSHTPADLFVEVDVYNWRLKMEFAVCLYYVGQVAEAKEFNQELLESNLTPQWAKAQLEANLGFCQRAQREDGCGCDK